MMGSGCAYPHSSRSDSRSPLITLPGAPEFNRTNFATLSPRGGLFGNNPFCGYEQTSGHAAGSRKCNKNLNRRNELLHAHSTKEFVPKQPLFQARTNFPQRQIPSHHSDSLDTVACPAPPSNLPAPVTRNPKPLSAPPKPVTRHPEPAALTRLTRLPYGIILNRENNGKQP
jgi:hypothetical protein